MTKPPIKLLAITHADRYNGSINPDPGHTGNGLARLKEIKRFLRETLSHNRYLVVRGTGRRFTQIHENVTASYLIESSHLQTTPFLGSADGNEDGTGDRILASGEVVLKGQYMNLAAAVRAGIYDPWTLISRYEKIARKSECTYIFFLVGGEFMNALQVPEFKSEEGSVYELLPDNNVVKLM